MDHTARSSRAVTPEHIPVQVYESSREAARVIGAAIAALIRERATEGRRAVLGLATGATPTALYDELVRLHREEHLSFKNVVTFNLDEYWPMPPDSIQSYRRFMREHLFDLVDIDPSRTHVPDGTITREGIPAFCAAYERAITDAGGIDIQILGVGRTGHIGFNEPGSPRDSRTRLITLDKVTRKDAASDFFGEWNVPRTALTMGVGTILNARRIFLMAFGEHKAAIIRRAVEGDVSHTVTASFLQQHPGVSIVLDHAAAAELTRFKTPWLLGPIAQFGGEWNLQTTKRAVIWLALHVGKPITKLTDEDYNEHGLQELLAARGSSRGAYDVNIEVFRSVQQTITGWPGGRPSSLSSPTLRVGRMPIDGPERGRVHIEGPGSGVIRSSTLHPLDVEAPSAQSRHAERGVSQTPHSESEVSHLKRVIVFSPHPDDDVISMGGTFIRLCEQGHDVHVAYQTSGNIAVWDESALRHVDFVAEFAAAFPQLGAGVAAKIEEAIESFIRRKAPGEVDSPELQKIKALIRRTEARAGARYSGVKESNIHFMDLPFYETGRVKKKPIGEDDIRITCDLLSRVRPHQVYAAGDLSDPHGTHRVCLATVIEAFKRLAGEPWMSHCQLWLYRGAWQEWGVDEIEMAVPLSPDEVARKRFAIFKHESQKDAALFPGPSDTREFWQRAEERNRATAKLYDRLGLPEYEAIEGFVRWR